MARRVTGYAAPRVFRFGPKLFTPPTRTRMQSMRTQLSPNSMPEQITTLEAAVAQYYLSAPNQQYEAVDPPDSRVTFRGDMSKMKICLDEMFAKLQVLVGEAFLNPETSWRVGGHSSGANDTKDDFI